ncbi:LacI family DNA-binding transcriptional regulator [Paenarthrobacter histidinolovorans]|uniref:LacI family DNA-binding transcriptional regulator n=1 Tax=Paenarthrobacter histidinolovorans TaxID=43664 RepID=UPI001668FBA9|nr:LacI family DNA-binding transcriptional regulator [Paenarthrobacter histidinolovorans]
MTSSADVATRAGVSRSTVSQILNGRGHLFTEETVALVRHTAEAMEYRPSLAGRTLARGKSDIVITLIPDITFGPPVREFVDLLTDGLAKAGLTNLLRLASSGSSLQDAILGLRPHAVVAMAQLSDEETLRLKRQGVHVLGFIPSAQAAVDLEIGRLQAAHLKSQGYDQIVAVRPMDKREKYSAPHRVDGVIQFGGRNDMVVLPTLEIGLTSHEALAALDSLPVGRVGMACYNDDVALAIVGAAQRRGLGIPGDVGVIGVDNSVVARASTPTISTIDISNEVNARELIGHILSGDQLEVEPESMSEHISGLKVIARESTGA